MESIQAISKGSRWKSDGATCGEKNHNPYSSHRTGDELRRLVIDRYSRQMSADRLNVPGSGPKKEPILIVS